MSGVLNVPECPRCGATMVARRRSSDNSAFWGCSRFPECRGTRGLEGGTPGVGSPAVASTSSHSGQSRRFHFDRVVLACGAVGLAVGLGFIAAAATVAPKTWAPVGAVFLFLVAVSVLPSPMLRPGYARSLAFRVACLIVFAGAFLVFWEPVSELLAQYISDALIQAIPTHTPAIPSAG